MLEKATITVSGKEYNFIKPYACDFIDIEDQCYTEEGFDDVKFNELILKLVSQKLKIEDLVIKNETEVELSSGDKLVPKAVPYKEYKKIVKENTPFTRNKASKMFLGMAGVTGEIILNNFTYMDITNMATAVYEMYDDSELEKVVDDITTFCFPKEVKED